MPTSQLSRAHPLIARLRRLARSAEARREEQVMLLEGIHLAQAAIDAGTPILEALASPKLERDAEGSALQAKLRRAGVAPRQVSDTVLGSLHDAASHQGILLLASRPRHDPDAAIADGGPHTLILLACGVQDPGNCGALVRLGEAAGAGAVVAAAGADPFGQKALRAAAGSTLRLPVSMIEGDGALGRWLQSARKRGFNVAAAETRGGTPHREASWSAPLILALGSEAGGLPAAVARHASQRVTIPIHSPVESLNVATAAAILLFEASHRLNLM